MTPYECWQVIEFAALIGCGIYLLKEWLRFGEIMANGERRRFK